MGALVTLELPDESPIHELPWIITFGPLGDDDEWEPVVCGPYERPQALALAESVVADEDLMAVVEPLLPRLSAAEILGEIAASRMAAEDDAVQTDEADIYGDYEDLLDEESGPETVQQRAEPRPAPTPEELRASMARIADKLGNLSG
ncbi:hypothetical protein ACI2K4_29890 [Micromonospora sp. NPDC050397]|uniref:hypothetical protein n=1 Tax=Micromonospora sp. NPDC050397 TaxID=3364279 RepID=UPI003850B1D6